MDKDNKETIQLDLNIISAQGLKRSRFGGKIQAYALAWIKPHTRLATHVDVDGDANPTWNTTMTFLISKNLLHKEPSTLIFIEIYNKGHLSDTLLGTVGVVVSNLLNKSMCHGGTQLCALQIRRPSGRGHGILNIGSMIVDPTTIDDDLNVTKTMPLETKLSQEEEDEISLESSQKNEEKPHSDNNQCEDLCQDATKIADLKQEKMVHDDQICTTNIEEGLPITNIEECLKKSSMLDKKEEQENNIIS